MEEKQINEVFDWDGVKLMPIEGDECKDCYLGRKMMICADMYECREEHRTDKKGVIFVLVDNQQQ